MYTTICLLKVQKNQSLSTTINVLPANPQYKCSLFWKCSSCKAIENLTQLVANSDIRPQGTHVILRSIFSCLCHFISGQVWKEILYLAPSLEELLKAEKSYMSISKCTFESVFRINAEKKYFMAFMIESSKFLVILMHLCSTQNLPEPRQESCFGEASLRTICKPQCILA